MNVYLVVRDGPEWTNLIKCFEDKKAAQSCADHHNANKGDDVYERLSTYSVVQMGVVKAKP